MNLQSSAQAIQNEQITTSHSCIFPTVMRAIKNVSGYASYALLCSSANCVTKNETDGEYYASGAVAQVPLEYITYTQVDVNAYKGMFVLRLPENMYNNLSFQSICLCAQPVGEGSLENIPVYNQLVFYEKDGSVKTFVKKLGESIVIYIEVNLTFKVSGIYLELIRPWEDNRMIRWFLGNVPETYEMQVRGAENPNAHLEEADHMNNMLYETKFLTLTADNFVFDEETNTFNINFNLKTYEVCSEAKLYFNSYYVARFPLVIFKDEYCYTESAFHNVGSGKPTLLSHNSFVGFDRIVNYRNETEVFDIQPELIPIPFNTRRGKINDIFTFYRNFEKFYFPPEKNMIAFLMAGSLDVFLINDDDSFTKVDTSAINVHNAVEVLVLKNHVFVFTSDEDVLRNYYLENGVFVCKENSIQDALTDKLYTLQFSKVVGTFHEYANGVRMFRFGVLPKTANTDGKTPGFVLEMAENENKDVWFQRSFICDEIDNISFLFATHAYKTMPDTILFATAQDSTTNAYGLRVFTGEPLACVTPEKEIFASFVTSDIFVSCLQFEEFVAVSVNETRQTVYYFTFPSGNYSSDRLYINIYENATYYSTTERPLIHIYDPIYKKIRALMYVGSLNNMGINLSPNYEITTPPRLVLSLKNKFFVIPDPADSSSAYEGEFMYNNYLIETLDLPVGTYVRMYIRWGKGFGFGTYPIDVSFAFRFEGEDGV